MDLVTEQKNDRQEAILEAARELIAEHGVTGVTIREIARVSRVSVPTLYYWFGGKDDLLARAVEGQLQERLRVVGSGRGRGADRILSVAGLCSGAIVSEPAYHRALLRAFMESTETHRLQLTLASVMRDQIAPALDEMCAEGDLRLWVDPALLADKITSAWIGSSITWGLGFVADEALEPSMVYDASMWLLGATNDAAKTRLERRARAAQRALARD